MAALFLWAAFGVATAQAQTNSDPTFPATAPTTLSVAENSAAGTVVGAVSATDADNDILTYSLGGADASSFALGASFGQIRITVGSGTTLDFEAAKNSYTVTMSVHDGKNSAGDPDTSVDATHDITINVTDETERPGAPGAPTVSAASSSSLSVSWTAPTNTGPAITDYDWRWKVQTAAGWTEKTDTTTTSTSATITGLTAGTAYHVAVRASNAEGTGDWSASGSGATSPQANRAPVFSGAPFTRSVPENSGTGTNVGVAVTATDPDGHALTYGLGGTDASSFAIGMVSGQITVAGGVTLDFEGTKKSYSVTVTASDGALSGTAAVTINVTDVNEAPAFPSNAPTSVSVDENNAAGAAVTTVTATDPDGTTPTYSLDGTSDAVFDISTAGAITVTAANALDHEDTASYTLTVTASDGTLSDTHKLTVNVTDVNDAPEFASATVARSVAENSAAGTNVGAAVTAADADGNSLDYSLGGADASSFEIDSAGGQITVAAAATLNFEATKNSYSVTVTASDGTLSDTATVNIDLTDVDEPPDEPSAPAVSAVAGTTDSLSVTWTAPNASGRPAIDDYDVRWFKGTADPATDAQWTPRAHGGTNTSTTIAGLDSGSTYRVQVRAGNDEGPGRWSASGIGSTFANANPDFPASAPSEFTVAENNVAGAAVGTVAAVDPDNDGLTYSLDATSDAVFDISTSGAITVTAANALDHEATASYSVNVSVHDGKDVNGAADTGVDATHAVTITVGDQDEPPPAPGTPTVTGGSVSLSVTWTAPDVADRPAIDDYDLRYFRGSSDPATDAEWSNHAHSGTATETTITGLVRGAPYRVQVRAANDEGEGRWSASGTAGTIVPQSPQVSSVVLTSTPSHDVNGDGTNETYAQDDVVRAQVTFDAAVDVAGNPTLGLRLAAGAARTMAFDASQGRTNVTTLHFSYTVAPGDASSGVGLPANGLRAPAGTTIRAENSTVDATLTHAAVAADAAHQVDTVGPSLVPSFPIRFAGEDADGNVSDRVPPGGTFTVDVVFAGEVDVTGAPRIELTVGRDRRYAGYRSHFVQSDPSGVQTLVNFRYTVAEGDADADGVAVPANGLELNGGTITNDLGNGPTPAQIAHGRVQSTITVDGVRPTVATAQVSEATLTVTFDEPLGAAASLARSAFTVKKTPQNGTEETVTLSGSPSISGAAVTLTLAAAVAATDGGVKVTYARPGSGSGNRIVDLAGNEAESFTDQQVSNVTGSANTGPSFPSTAPTSFDVEENNAAGAAVGTVQATDPDGDPLTYSLDPTSNAVFDISAGAITVTAANALDFEAKNSYRVTVSVSDGRNSQGDTDSTIDATVTVTVNVTNVDEPPATPSTPTVSAASAESLEVTWTATEVTGRPAITGYDVHYFKGTADPDTAAGERWSDHDHVGTGTTTTISDLDPESAYRVQVRAVNADGESAWSASGSGSTGLVPTVPSFNGGATLSVDENSGGGTAVGTVAATDADGDVLTYSLTSSGTDHDAFAIDGDGAITVAPGATLDYEAQQSYSISVQVTDGEDASGAPETAPTIDDTVAVTIEVTDLEERPEVPRAPAVNAVADSPDSLTVTWAAPEQTGRPPITGYGVRYKLSSESGWSSHPHGDTSTTTTISGLEVGATYDVQVQAINDDGPSDWSTSVSGTTAAANANPSFPETAPTVLSVAENSAVGTVVGTVAATDPDAGDTLSYLLDSASGAVFDIDSGGTITVAAADVLDHEGAPSWSVTVSVHDGKDSDGVDEVTPTVDARIEVTVDVTDVAEPPPAPEVPTLNAASATSLTVTWAAPDVAGRPPITGYGVRYRKSSESAWTTHAHPGADTTATIAGLEADTGYDVQVQATNDEGTGDWSISGSATTPAGTVIAPSAPAAPTVSAASATSLTVSWTAPSDPGSASSIADYDLRYYAGAADPAAEADWIEEGEINGPPDPGSSASATITGLEPGTAYRVQVRAYGIIESPWSASGSATTQAPPHDPDVAPGFGTSLVRALTLLRDEAMAPEVLPEATGGNGALSYGLTSAPPGLAGLDFDATLRTLSGTPRNAGSYVFTYRADDADGNRADSDAAILTFEVTVNAPPAPAPEPPEPAPEPPAPPTDPPPARTEVVQRTLATVGTRTLASAVDSIGSRFANVAPVPALTLASRTLPLAVPGAAAAVPGAAAAARSAGGAGAQVARPGITGAGAALAESAVAVPLAGTAADDPQQTLLALWARGDLAVFEGRPEPGSWYEGETLTGWLGVDVRSGPWVGGLAFSHGNSTAQYRVDGGDADDEQGGLELTLTALYPYGSYTSADGVELRAIVGGGLGEARDRLGERAAETSDVAMLTGTVGVRHPVPFLAGIDLAARADVGLTHLETADGPDAIDGLRAKTLRGRLGLEASSRFVLGDAGLVPFVEAIGRLDVGDDFDFIDTALEVAGGLRLTSPWLQVGARGRLLAVHSEESTREHGLSVTVRLNQAPDGSGLALSLSPRWGAATGAAEALWREELPRLAEDASAGPVGLDARIGYGVPLSAQGAMLTPFAEALIAAGQSRRLKVGTRYEATGTNLLAELSGEPGHGIDLNLKLSF